MIDFLKQKYHIYTIKGHTPFFDDFLGEFLFDKEEDDLHVIVDFFNCTTNDNVDLYDTFTYSGAEYECIGKFYTTDDNNKNISDYRIFKRID